MQQNEISRENTLNTLLRRSAFPVLQFTENYPAGRIIKYARAPHTVHIMGSAFIAIDKYCAIKGDVIVARKPKNPLEHLIKEFPSHSSDLQTREIISDFLTRLDLTNIYEMELNDPFDLNGRISIITVLAVMWKFFGNFEPDTFCNVEHLRNILDAVIDKFELRIPGKDAIFHATIEGSEELVHFIVDEVSRNRITSNAHFENKYDLIFIQTNLHNNDFVPQTFGNADVARDLREAFIEEDPDMWFPEQTTVATLMNSFSKNRLARRNYFATDLEKHCQEAMEDLKEEHIVEGFEVQQGGVLATMKKGNYHRNTLMQAIKTALCTETDLPITMLTIRLLKNGVGVSNFLLTDVRRFPAEQSVEVENGARAQPARLSEKPNACEETDDDDDATTTTGNESFVRDQDETFDEEE